MVFQNHCTAYTAGWDTGVRPIKNLCWLMLSAYNGSTIWLLILFRSHTYTVSAVIVQDKAHPADGEQTWVDNCYGGLYKIPTAGQTLMGLSTLIYLSHI